MKDLLPKINEVMNEDFVGNYMFSDEELTKIYDFVGNLLRSFDSRSGNLPQRFDELIFIAMVNATKTWKTDEDTFWECIYKKLIGTGGSQKNIHVFNRCY